jgi:dTDP-D-glucose 4,6-dehydratase
MEFEGRIQHTRVCSKARAVQNVDFEVGFKSAIDRYLANPGWWGPLRSAP